MSFMILYSEGVKYDFLELSRQFHVILHGYQNGDDDETVFACICGSQKRTSTKTGRDAGCLLKVFIFSNLPFFLVQISFIEQLSID